MKSKILIMTALTLCVLLMIAWILSTSYPWLDGENKPLAKIYLKGKNIDIAYIQSSTSKDFIQIACTEDKGKQRIIKNIENNNSLEGYHLLNDSTISVVVNKSGYFKNKPDTVEVSIKTLN